jgi:hypothetical protein
MINVQRIESGTCHAQLSVINIFLNVSYDATHFVMNLRRLMVDPLG